MNHHEFHQMKKNKPQFTDFLKNTSKSNKYKSRTSKQSQKTGGKNKKDLPFTLNLFFGTGRETMNSLSQPYILNPQNLPINIQELIPNKQALLGQKLNDQITHKDIQQVRQEQQKNFEQMLNKINENQFNPELQNTLREELTKQSQAFASIDESLVELNNQQKNTINNINILNKDLELIQNQNQTNRRIQEQLVLLNLEYPQGRDGQKREIRKQIASQIIPASKEEEAIKQFNLSKRVRLLPEREPIKKNTILRRPIETDSDDDDIADMSPIPLANVMRMRESFENYENLRSRFKDSNGFGGRSNQNEPIEISNKVTPIKLKPRITGRKALDGEGGLRSSIQQQMFDNDPIESTISNPQLNFLTDSSGENTSIVNSINTVDDGILERDALEGGKND